MTDELFVLRHHRELLLLRFPKGLSAEKMDRAALEPSECLHPQEIVAHRSDAHRSSEIPLWQVSVEQAEADRDHKRWESASRPELRIDEIS